MVSEDLREIHKNKNMNLNTRNLVTIPNQDLKEHTAEILLAMKNSH